MNIIVYGIPVGKGSMRALPTNGGRTIVTNDSPKTRIWQDAIAFAAGSKPGINAHLDCPCELLLTFGFIPPKRRTRVYPAVRPDADKLARTVLDALTGIAYADDSQVVGLTVEKNYDELPGVEILVRWFVDGKWVDA